MVIKTGYILLRNIYQNCFFFENWDRQIINKSSLLCIKQRIFDNVTQSLYADIENSKKCIFYKYLIDGFHIQHYLRKAIPSKYQKIISKLRLSSHTLAIETGRYNKTNRNDRKCFNCSDYVEDEFHFILVCPKYNDYRLRFLKKYYWEKPSMFKLLQLFNSENFTELCNLGRFLLLAMKRRNCLQIID